jgi:uncharacterized protein (TIGR02391 family)
MPWLINLIPDADALCALEPDELGLRMLPALASWPPHQTLSCPDFVRSVVNRGASPVLQSQYPPQRGADVEIAIREAWAWLEGAALLIEHPGFVSPNLIRLLSRRAQQLAKEPDARKVFAARRIPKEALHPTIREDVWTLYHRGKYDTAVFEAMKAVEVAVREASKMPTTLLGVKLMRAAFAPSPNAGPLTDTGADGGEQVARMELFAGAIGSYKNPQSHRNVALDDPDETAEVIMLANHLLRIVSSRSG